MKESMESSDQYNFNLFQPRNLHGKKNRNVILSMLLIWAVAVFGFQFLLRGIQKPTPEKALNIFETVWPLTATSELVTIDYKSLLNSLVLVKGKTTVTPADQKILNDAISCITFNVVPDSIKNGILNEISLTNTLKSKVAAAKDEEFLNLKTSITGKLKSITALTAPFSGFQEGSLEEIIFTGSLSDSFPESITDISFSRLPEVMKLYLTHNQSVLTDTRFLGFPFHYFYTAVFLLVLFIGLCIVYNLLIEWRLKKQGVVE